MIRLTTSESSKHGIGGAYYVSNGEQYQPCIECCCGWSTEGESWEEAGRELDEHLEED